MSRRFARELQSTLQSRFHPVVTNLRDATLDEVAGPRVRVKTRAARASVSSAENDSYSSKQRLLHLHLPRLSLPSCLTRSDPAAKRHSSSSPFRPIGGGERRSLFVVSTFGSGSWPTEAEDFSNELLLAAEREAEEGDGRMARATIGR